MKRFFLLFALALAMPILVLGKFLPNVYAAVDPIAYWKFDDGSGTTPDDSSANNINGSFLTPNPVWSTDVPSAITFDDPYSLDFTGSGDGVSITWPADQNFAATDPRSFSFWYKPTANGEGGGTMARIISWSSDQFEIAGTDGSSSTHRIAYYDGSWNSTDINLTLGTWYHVTFTYDGTTAKFYIGNDLQDEHALAGRALSGTMMIGNRVQNSNEGINGFIDDVRVYDYALNSTQVSNLSSGASNPDGDPSPTPSPSASASLNSNSPTVYHPPSTTEPPSCSAQAPQHSPDLFQVDTAGTYANLYFTTVKGANGYNVQYGVKSEANEHGDLFGYSGDLWTIGRTISQLLPNTSYSFKVQAVNGCTSGPWSKTMTVKTKGRSVNISRLFANLNPFKASTPTLITSTAKPGGQAVAGVSKKSGSCSYTVQSGDSFWKIASSELGSGKMFGDLMSLNPGVFMLKVGQKISVCE